MQKIICRDIRIDAEFLDERTELKKVLIVKRILLKISFLVINMKNKMTLEFALVAIVTMLFAGIATGTTSMTTNEKTNNAASDDTTGKSGTTDNDAAASDGAAPASDDGIAGLSSALSS
ncbi:MAG: hypothetical protein AB9879_04075 [Methanothrix sp.]